MSDCIASTELHCTHDGSDKVYCISILREHDGSFKVKGENARSGHVLKLAAMNSFTTEAIARAYFESQILKKITKGHYRVRKSFEETIVNIATDHVSGLADVCVPLLRPIGENDLQVVISKASACKTPLYMQEKFDGERRLIECGSTVLRGINRSKKYIDLPVAAQASILKDFPAGTILDGEQIGENLFIAFDILSYGEESLANVAYLGRFTKLQKHLTPYNGQPVSSKLFSCFYAPTVMYVSSFAPFMASSRADGAEGVVVRRADGILSDGRPTMSEDRLKLKFYETASVVVMHHNKQRSVAMGVYTEDGTLQEIGNVTIGGIIAMPEVGSVIEVRYLYAYPNGGSLFQPTYLHPRTDIPDTDCVISQLKYVQLKSQTLA